MNLEGKRVLITGGTSGIGKAIVHALLDQGANVITFGRTEQSIKSLIDETYGKAQVLHADLLKLEDIKKVFEFIDTNHKGLDVLINNAGVGGGRLLEESLEKAKDLIDINLFGYIACTKLALDRLKKSRSAHIVNIGSMSAELKEADIPTYVATKSAVRGFTHSLRRTLNKEGIKVTLIEPGSVDTGMTESSKEENLKMIEEGRMLEPQNIANAVLFSLTQERYTEIASIQIKPFNQFI